MILPTENMYLIRTGALDRLTPAERGEMLRLARDPVYFVRSIWKELGRDAVAPLNDLDDEMILWAFEGPDRRGCLALRGGGKTTELVAPLCLNRWFIDPDWKTLVLSKSETEAKKTVGMIRAWINAIWFFQWLAPEAGTKDSDMRFDVGPGQKGNRQPSMQAIGVEGQLEGNRAHLIIGDDCETDKNTESQETREKLDARLSELSVIRYPDPRAETFIVGTYHHEESVYLKLSQRGYQFQTWTIAAPAREDKFLGLSPLIQKKLDDGRLKYTEGENYDKCPTFPLRFPSPEIKKRMEEGRRFFGMQCMLKSDVGLSIRFPLRLADLIVMDVDRDKAPISLVWGTQSGTLTGTHSTAIDGVPMLGFQGDGLYRPVSIDHVWAPYQVTKAYIDPAGGVARRNDFTGLSIAGLLNGLIFLKACLGLKVYANADGLGQIADLLRLHGVQEAYYEGNIDTFDTYGPLLELEMRKRYLDPGKDDRFPHGWRCSLIKRKVSGVKEYRIVDTLDEVLRRHRLVTDRLAVTRQADEEIAHTLQFQLSHMQRRPKCLTEDGKIDSLASLVAEFRMNLAINPETGRDRQHNLMLKGEMDAARRGLGFKVVRPTWTRRIC